MSKSRYPNRVEGHLAVEYPLNTSATRALELQHDVDHVLEEAARHIQRINPTAGHAAVQANLRNTTGVKPGRSRVIRRERTDQHVS